jgi:hypothetical protein
MRCFHPRRDRCLAVLIFCAAATLPAACGGGGGGGSGSGPTASPPSISGFAFEPHAIYVDAGNGTQTVIGSIDYSDPDGDIETLTLLVLGCVG